MRKEKTGQIRKEKGVKQTDKEERDEEGDKKLSWVFVWRWEMQPWGEYCTAKTL